MIIILEKDKITEHVKYKLLKKGLSLVGMSDFGFSRFLVVRFRFVLFCNPSGMNKFLCF